MKYTVELTEEAEKQLDEATGWYADESRDIAARWYNGFRKAIRSLAENPQRFGFARENDASPYELRALLYGSGKRKTHRAVFRIVEHRVEVLAIRHVSQQDLNAEEL